MGRWNITANLQNEKGILFICNAVSIVMFKW